MSFFLEIQQILQFKSKLLKGCILSVKKNISTTTGIDFLMTQGILPVRGNVPPITRSNVFCHRNYFSWKQRNYFSYDTRLITSCDTNYSSYDSENSFCHRYQFSCHKNFFGQCEQFSHQGLYVLGISHFRDKKAGYPIIISCEI